MTTVCALCGSAPARGMASVLQNGQTLHLCHDATNDCYVEWTVRGRRSVPGGMSDLTIPEVDVPLRDKDTQREMVARVLRVATQLPRWNTVNTHYEECWKYHTECLATLLIDVMEEPEVQVHG